MKKERESRVGEEGVFIFVASPWELIWENESQKVVYADQLQATTLSSSQYVIG